MTRRRAALAAGAAAALLLTGPAAAGIVWALPAGRRSVWVVWGVMSAIFVVVTAGVWLAKGHRAGRGRGDLA